MPEALLARFANSWCDIALVTIFNLASGIDALVFFQEESCTTFRTYAWVRGAIAAPLNLACIADAYIVGSVKPKVFLTG